jgi:hypothetical protein
LATTHQKIASAREYFDDVVVPDFDDFIGDTTSLRKAFHCANSLFHLHDWVISEHPEAFQNCKTARDLAKFLATQSSDFLIVKDLANATKHMHINSGQVLVHAGASTVQSTGYGEGGYGMGPYGGGPRVRIQTVAGDVEFTAVAKTVLDMWKQMFAFNGW